MKIIGRGRYAGETYPAVGGERGPASPLVVAATDGLFSWGTALPAGGPLTFATFAFTAPANGEMLYLSASLSYQLSAAGDGTCQLTYNLDGGGPVPFGEATCTDVIVAQLGASVLLGPLAVGAHTLVVQGFFGGTGGTNVSGIAPSHVTILHLPL